MSRKITQQTFNEAVKENVDEFSMTTEEAIESAIKEFQSQGVDLQNIITNALLTNEVDILMEKINKLKVLEDNPEAPELPTVLKDIKNECDSDIAKRVLAGQCGLYHSLITHLQKNQQLNESLKTSLLETLVSLVTGYPDLLENDGFQFIVSSLKKPNEQLLLVLKLGNECCVKHEANREKFVNNEEIMSSLKRIMEDDTASSEVIRAVCKLFQTFVLNDDIRAEIPHAHQHACQIFTDFLNPFMRILKKFKSDSTVLVSVTQALAAIIVRNEFCQSFTEEGGLEIIRQIIIDFPTDENLFRSCLGLIKVVAGNDQVKAKVLSITEPAVLVSSAQKFVNSPKTCNQALSTLSMLALRNASNCKLLAENNVAELTVQSLKVHSKQKNLVKNACWLIRNLTQANEQLTPTFLNMGVEECLRGVLKNYEDCSFEANLALRLLGCEVELKELWTGEGKGITN